MPTLAEWPVILASAAEAVLSVAELGYTMPVHSSPPAGFNTLPCVVIEWGAGGVMLEPGNAGSLSTLSQLTARFEVRLVVGDPGVHASAEIVLDALQRLYAGLAAAVAADADSGGFSPVLGDVLTPTAEEYAAVGIWSARIPLAVSVTKIPPTIP